MAAGTKEPPTVNSSGLRAGRDRYVSRAGVAFGPLPIRIRIACARHVEENRRSLASKTGLSRSQAVEKRQTRMSAPLGFWENSCPMVGQTFLSARFGYCSTGCYVTGLALMRSAKMTSSIGIAHDMSMRHTPCTHNPIA